MNPVPQILDVWMANAGGFVILAVLVLFLGTVLYRVLSRMIASLDRRIENCETKHDACEEQNKRLQIALIEMADHHGNGARERVMATLTERGEQ